MAIKSVQALKNQQLIADQCHVAERFSERLKGWIGKRTARRGEAILFPRCNSVHMWFMSMAIDVVFLAHVREQGGKPVFVVTSLRERIKPWRLLPAMDLRASHALELPEGTARERGLMRGDELCIG